jgi:selenocysteine lyase/cysteine desulfurase
MAPGALATTLFDKYRVFTVAINRPEAGVQGVRVTPHLYTTTRELDVLVRALTELAS